MRQRRALGHGVVRRHRSRETEGQRLASAPPSGVERAARPSANLWNPRMTIDIERQIGRATLPSWTVNERDSAYGKTEKRVLVTVLS